MSPLRRLMRVAPLLFVAAVAVPAEALPLPALAESGDASSTAGPDPPRQRQHVFSGLAGRIASAGGAINKGIETGAERIREHVHGHLDRVIGEHHGRGAGKTTPPALQVPAGEDAVHSLNEVTTAVSHDDVVDMEPSVASIPLTDLLGVATTAVPTTMAGPTLEVDPDLAITTPSVMSTTVEDRNLIRAPQRCAPGLKPDSKGTCREIY